ncbi:methyltransferase type 11 [Oleiphilus messinensis]|uniref:Methyltransferase type 11 n=1 Tax=Oleiphilus messinensis TaxID=141451 RepID=A0A1Y0I6H6_9GAMM|nr:methyltransferase domain-containing protein [Oleiphilus messinensis]ARU55003.1 methyltransferase type 11 [Oleiphilus messinensis]
MSQPKQQYHPEINKERIFKALNAATASKASPAEYDIPTLDPVDLYPIPTLVTSETLKSQTAPSVSTIYDVLAFHDRQFIELAYDLTLGRYPDESGMQNYLHQLRSGQCDKKDVLARLLLSPEGRGGIGKLKGSLRIISRYLLTKIPIIRFLVDWLITLVRLPRVVRALNAHHQYQLGVGRDLVDHAQLLARNESENMEILKSRINELSRRAPSREETEHLHELLRKSELASYGAFDDFYRQLENRFRGPETELAAKFNHYDAYIDRIYNDERIREPRALDLGCGRCEWLNYVAAKGFAPTGVDSNAAMMEGTVNPQLTLVQDDLLTYLQSVPDNSFSIVSAFHVIEHLPSGYLLNMIKEVYRVLQPGGAMLLETPNPQNLIVGSHTFYIDPTHLQPVPPQLVEFMAEYNQFLSVELIFSSPSTDSLKNDQNDPGLARVDNLLFGPQDYAVWGRK